eukprot:5126551-Pyramimonas_sp.AAC.1
MPISIPSYEYTQVGAGEVYTPLCTAEGNGVGSGGAQLPAGIETAFLIRSFDRWGNRRTKGGVVFDTILRSVTKRLTRALTDLELLQISAGILDAEQFYTYQQDGRYFVRPSIAQDKNDGTYEVIYTPMVAAFYFVEINRGGTLIKDAPFVVEVKPDVTNATASLVFCKSVNNCGLESAQAGIRSV